jgi:hypothetical protein
VTLEAHFSSTPDVFPHSLVEHEAAEFDLVAAIEGLLLIGPLSPHNIAALRQQLPWLKPRPLGLKTSASLAIGWT